MSTAPFIIYMLVDPREYRPYYIGQTRDRVKRHRFHFAHANGDSTLARRNREVVDAGSVPLLIVLEEATSRTEALIQELLDRAIPVPWRAPVQPGAPPDSLSPVRAAYPAGDPSEAG